MVEIRTPIPVTEAIRRNKHFRALFRIGVMPVGLDKPNIVTPLAGADGLIRLPGETEPYEKGSEVTVLFLDNQQGSAAWLKSADDLMRGSD